MKNTLAIVFPGQGSQRLGMLSDFSENCIFQKTFHEASDVLGYDLWRLIQYGPEEELNRTYRTQPAILASSVAIWRIWTNKYDFVPHFMAGHSLGEYSALVCSGVIDFSSALKLVEFRGILMQDAVSSEVGSMSVIIGLDESVVISICEQFTFGNQIVSLSAFNAPDHVVISGHRESVENVNNVCRQLGAKLVLILPISVPSHCKLMFPMADKLRKKLETINFLFPVVSVVNNVDVGVENNLDSIKEALVRQVYMPVRWKETIEYFVKHNVNVLIEMGPGNVLSRITKRIVDDSLLSISVNNVFSLNSWVDRLISR